MAGAFWSGRSNLIVPKMAHIGRKLLVGCYRAWSSALADLPDVRRGFERDSVHQDVCSGPGEVANFRQGASGGVRWGEGGFVALVGPTTTFPDINVLYNAGVALRALHAEDDGLICPEVGGWAENKYRLLALYDKLFSTGMKNKWDQRVYIDLYAGAGYSRIQGTKTVLMGSPIIALTVPDTFDKYIFC